MTPSSINALGVRLAKADVPTSEDFDLLSALQDEYMQPLEQTGDILRERLNLADHGSFNDVPLTASNRLKTTGPIIDKCRRKTRLSAMQDIVGYRIVGDLTLRQQDELVTALKICFPGARVVDRRARPMHGYRAVHIIADVDGFPVEIQVRTSSQDRWAQTMERYGDVYGREIRYGELPPDLSADDRRAVALIVERLKTVGDHFARYEGVLDKLTRSIQKVRLLKHQRQQFRTRRIKRSFETAETELRDLRVEFGVVDSELRDAIKRLTG
jgi:ppGpp synthetase/RelA/SpoT-type nucleotidyltranferase